MNSTDIHGLQDSDLLTRIYVIRDQIAKLNATKLLLLEEARDRVDVDGGLIVTSEYIAVIGAPLEIETIDISALRNHWSNEDLAARNLLLVKNRRAAVRIYYNPTKLQVEVDEQ